MIADPPSRSMPAHVARRALLCKVVLGSRAPRRAAAWYRRALDLPDADAAPKAGDAVLRAGNVDLHIVYRSHIGIAAAEPIRAVLNFVVDDILAVEARLIVMEAIWVRELERTPSGIIGTVLDVDGNYVQIIEPARVDVAPTSGGQGGGWQ
jgi:hypothetical protein